MRQQRHNGERRAALDGLTVAVRRPRRTEVRAIFAAAVVALGLAGARGVSGATPDPTPEPRFFLRSRAVLDAWELRRLDGQTSAHRVVRQRLDMVWTEGGPAPGVFGQVSGSFRFDEGLSSRPPQPLVRELQLQPELHVALVRWRVGPAAALTVGRHDPRSEVAFARVDGASAAWSGEGWRVYAVAGLRPEDGILRIDGWSYQADTDRALRTEFGDHTALFEGGAGYSERSGALGLAVRHEVAVDREFVDGTRVAFSGRVGASDSLHLAGRLVGHGQLGAIEDVELAASAPLGDAWVVSVAGSRYAPLLPMDSVFVVFGPTEYSEERAASRWTTGRGRLDLAAFHRASRPLGGARETASDMVGGRVAGRVIEGGGAASLDGSLEAAAGEGSDALRGHAGASWQPRRGPSLHARQTVGTQRLSSSGLGRRTGTWGSLGMMGTVGSRAELGLSSTTGWDTSNRWTLRVLATADISLSGAR